MIDLTPLEVRKKKGDFRRALRGYESALVDDFLDLVADRIEQLLRDNAALTERLTGLDRRNAEYRDRERALTDALVTAQEMREEIRAQTEREAELALRTSSQEAEARVREAEQRAETVVRAAEQQAEAVIREAEQRAQTLVRESEQHAATTVRAAEQGADDTLRRAQQEAEAERLRSHQEAELLRTELIQVREREEEALRHVRLHRQQQLSSYRDFLERELSELDIVAASLGDLSAVSERSAGTPAPEQLRSGPPRDSRAAAAAAVLAQSFLAEESDQLDTDTFPVDPSEFEPFEPEQVYEEDLEPPQLLVEAEDVKAPQLLVEGVDLVLAEAEEPEAEEAADQHDDLDTTMLLENAELAGYRLELADEVGEDSELLLEEPATEKEEEKKDNDDDDWLTRMIEEPR
jgi:DivIVA domain-containing protein